MRTLVIGDIHGCFTALSTLAREMAFTDDDLIITLGDYVDRGPRSKSVIDWLLARKHRGGKLVALQGNHEIIMLSARSNSAAQKAWMGSFVGGTATLQSYGHDDSPGLLRDIPAEHWDFIENQTVRYYETDTHIFVHASVVPELPMDQQPDEALFWERFKPLHRHCSGKIVICGHTSQHDGIPARSPHGLCIDTWSYGEGWLTCLNVETNEYGQANQRGQYRTGTVKPVAGE